MEKKVEKKEEAQPTSQKKMSPEERNRLKEVFDRYDRDKSGSIDIDELTDMCTELGAKVTEEQAKQLMKELDQDGNGTIEFGEFAQFWTEHPCLGKYRNCVTSARRASGMQAMMGGILQTLAPAITQNNLLKRLREGQGGAPTRTATVE